MGRGETAEHEAAARILIATPTRGRHGLLRRRFKLDRIKGPAELYF